MPNDRHLQKAISRGRPPGRLNRLTACAKRAQLKALSEDKAISEDAADLAQIADARNEPSVPWKTAHNLSGVESGNRLCQSGLRIFSAGLCTGTP